MSKIRPSSEKPWHELDLELKLEKIDRLLDLEEAKKLLARKTRLLYAYDRTVNEVLAGPLRILFAHGVTHFLRGNHDD